MRFLPLVAVFLLAACASTGEQASIAPPPPTRAPHGSHRHGQLVGLTVPELGELFGPPTLQVREGPGVKLQYRGAGCVLDAYLYPPEGGAGVERVTHVDTRAVSGVDTDPVSCEAAIEAAR